MATSEIMASTADDSPRPPAPWPARAGFIQFRVQPGAPAANLALVRERLAGLELAGSAVLVLPELWGGGFAYQTMARQAEETPRLLAALTEEARRYGIYLAGSLPEAAVADGGGPGFYNTMYLVGPAGVLGKYHKQQLFAPMGETEHFRSGADPKPLRAPWGPVGSLVCFDLRFPALAAAQAVAGADLLLVAAQWPLARREHWRVLLRARAIENQVFVVAANTCGRIGDTDFAGSSAIIAPDGEVLAEAGLEEASRSVPLDMARLQEARRLFRTVGSRP